MEFANDYINHFTNIHAVNTEGWYDIRADFRENFVKLLEELHCQKFYLTSIEESLWYAMSTLKTYYHTPVHIMSIFAFKQRNHSILPRSRSWRCGSMTQFIVLVARIMNITQ